MRGSFVGDPAMWEDYVAFCTQNPFHSAWIQFAILGSFGEILSTMIRQGAVRYPFSAVKTIFKGAGWAVLGLYIKVMFLGTSGAVIYLADHGILPLAVKAPDTFPVVLLAAFAGSTLMNLMMGPSMMIFHRIIDNLIDRITKTASSGWAGMDKSMVTLIWLWIPLHTFTFTQAKDVRIGIAAVLSLLLGLVMGWFNRKKT